MQTAHAITAHWNGPFSEEALRAWAVSQHERMTHPVSLGLVFMTPEYFADAPRILEILRVHARIPLLAGCSSNSLVMGTREIENQPGLVLALHHLPGASLRAVRFTQEQVEEANGPGYWQMGTGVDPASINGWLVFADPFHLDAETWLREWTGAFPDRPIIGGLASGSPSQPATQIYLDGEVLGDGGVGIAVGGKVALTSVISQGCTPIGDTWTITAAERNHIHRIGNRPAYEVLAETFNGLPAADQERARGNLFVGLVMNEYLEEFHRGDFLVRNILGADPASGSLAIGAIARVGQTLQFQKRDADAAHDDMTDTLRRAEAGLAGRTIYGGCLCSCNGRGEGLFGGPHHDAAMIQKALGPLALSGFFCNGEIGPVGAKSHLHGYTASLALFTSLPPGEKAD